MKKLILALSALVVTGCINKPPMPSVVADIKPVENTGPYKFLGVPGTSALEAEQEWKNRMENKLN